MKIKHLLIGMLAMAAAVACKQDEPVEEPVLEVNKTAVALAATAGESTFNVTANNAWSASADADWVSLDPASGDASKDAVTVKVTAEDNTATEARVANVTVKSGELTRTIKVNQAAAQGEQPGPGDDPVVDETKWGMMGCFVDNLWSKDVPMAKEGEWIVAKGAQFTELTFKIRGNESWADATNIGVAPGSERGVVNGKVAVVTAEYSKANLGGDAADIKLNGEAGTYDVYFSVENMEVYVMEQGYKPGEKEPQNPDPVEITYTVVGTLNNINWNNSAPEGLMAAEGQYLVAKNVPFVTAATLYGGADQFEFKIVETGTWTGYGRAEDVVTPVNGEIAVKMGGDNIMVTGAEGNYDVYFDKANLKVWVVTPGTKPGETPVQPEKETAQLVTFLSFTSNVASGQNTVTVQLAAEGLSSETVTSEWGTYDQIVGAGKYLKFDAYSADGTLAAGTYNASAVGGTVNEGEFSIGYDTTVDLGWGPMEMTNWGTCWMTHNADGTETGVKITDGTITVAVEGDVYTITVKSSVLEATYVGKLSKDAGETPENPDPEQPELEVSDWAIVGSFTGEGWGWDPAAGLALSVLDENYFVYYGLELAEGAQFKFLQGGAWGGAEVGADRTAVEPNTIQAKGGSNIYVTTPGKYDIYLAADASKYYVMSEGKTPAEATEPSAAVATYTVTGTLQGKNWDNMAAEGLMTQEGAYYVAKNVPFVTAAELYGGADQIEFKICNTGSWDAAYGAPTTDPYNANAEIPVAENGNNVAVAAPSGAYDVYFDKDNGKVWVMNPGLKPGETPAEPEPEYELDGKQWYYANMGVLVDLGLYEEGAMVVAVPLNDGSGFGAYMYGAYEIVKTDATSGKVVFTQYDPEWDEFMAPVDYPYSELSENLVMIGAEPLTGDPTPLPFVALEEPFEIVFEEVGGADPVGPIENGQYWFFNGTKVMAPLAEGETTGLLPAGNVIDGASTEKNIFTLMYDPDMSYYTIMDSYGRFLGQTDETGNITVTDVLPTGEDYALYLWCVETGYGEATSIYNAAYYFDITYSATDNKWVLVDGGYETPSILPTLVKAENPVEEPVEPAGPKVVTVAEFNAATDNTIEYQVSGTISGIYQAYNASYDNISLYISDETGEMLAYRLSCAGINDPANTLTKGDLITVKGMRTLYNENPQMAQGGVIVEHTDVVVEAPAGSAELSFADKANRTVFTTSQQVWEQNGIKLINDKGASTSNVADYAAPARFYKSSKITVEYAGMTKIEFVCNNGSYATALKSSITTGTVTVNGSVVTVVLPAAADSYVVESLTGGQVRMDSLTVYAE